jgi:Protein of unknown function (DUF2796)
MKAFPTLAVLGALAVQSSAAEEPHRQLGAHEHGRGTLNIAVEGNKMTMELEAPGMDIVGFEHAAKSRRDTEAIENAKVQLQRPLSLFKLPRAAGCRVIETSVKIELGEHDHDAKEEHGPAGIGEDPKQVGTETDGHSEFHAGYTCECASVNNITAIEFSYFRVFAGAEKLDVSVITPKGQSKFEATRAKPNISLAGMM